MKKNKNKLHRFIKEDLKNKGIEIPKELLDLKKSYNSTEIKQLISYNDFKNFLLDNIVSKKTTKRNITVSSNALQFRSKRFTNYEDINSNKQFTTLYNLNNSQLIAMLNYFIGQADTEHVFNMIKNYNSDKEILSYIKKHFKLKKANINKEFKSAKIIHVVYRFFLKQRDNIIILDVGVGNGKKIKSITSFLNEKYELYGADIEEWGTYKKNRILDFPYKVIQLNPYKIPYPDKMFDCIFITLTLHHAKNILDVIKECHRILKDDGCIVLIEHDVWTDDTHMLVDLQHRIYSTVYNEPPSSVNATYYNFYEWDILFNKGGFKFIHGEHIQEDVAYNHRYDMEFMTIYCKKEYKYKMCIER
jgi:ubiquinone/menaquinone biosynthesis C-methylase UbiE